MPSHLLLFGKAAWQIDVDGVLVVHYSADASHRGVYHPLLLVQGPLLYGVGQRAGVRQEAHVSDSKVAHTWRARGESHENIESPFFFFFALGSNTVQFNFC